MAKGQMLWASSALTDCSSVLWIYISPTGSAISCALVKWVRQGGTFPKGIVVSYNSKTSVTEEISYFDMVQEGGKERSRNFIARPA